MRGLLFIFAFVVVSACVNESSMPLGNDMMQIDVSAAPVYGRAGAQRIAYESAAKATVEAGYDKFIVVGSQSWNELGASGGSHSNYNASGSGMGYNASSSSGGGFRLFHKPESTLVIKMFKYKDKEANKAVDAHEIVKKLESKSNSIKRK